MSGRSHEAYIEHKTIAPPSDRSFGLWIGGILIGIAAIRWALGHASMNGTLILAGPGALLVALGLVYPRILAPLNKAWMKFGFLLASIVNPLIMLLIFSVMFVPLAILMRLNGRDALALKRKPGTASYWTEREPPGPAPEGMANQY